MLLFVILMILAYLIGSFNTSIVYSVNNYNKDIRKEGSGNAGTTNMLRSFGTWSAVITFLGDILKSVLAIGIAWFVFRNAMNLDLIKTLIGFACVLGHRFPIFFQFKGGKGIATGAGCILMLDWRVFLAAIALFVICVLITKYVSVGSIISALVYPIGLLICHKHPAAVVVAALTTLFVIACHWKNITALIQGKERKLGSHK